MDNLVLDATATTPLVRFEHETGKLLLEGESYPENANRFFEPVFAWLETYVHDVKKPIEISFKLNYFNTSSSKCLLDLLEILEQFAEDDGEVKVHWYYREDDEDILESGEEFAEDVSLKFSYISY